MPGSRLQPSQATKRKKDKKKKERNVEWGKKRGEKMTGRLRTERKRRKPLVFLEKEKSRDGEIGEWNTNIRGQNENEKEWKRKNKNKNKKEGKKIKRKRASYTIIDLWVNGYEIKGCF
jgi:hypothetical protein